MFTTSVQSGRPTGRVEKSAPRLRVWLAKRLMPQRGKVVPLEAEHAANSLEISDRRAAEPARVASVLSEDPLKIC